jgi:hypothetical protein
VQYWKEDSLNLDIANLMISKCILVAASTLLTRIPQKQSNNTPEHNGKKISYPTHKL